MKHSQLIGKKSSRWRMLSLLQVLIQVLLLLSVPPLVVSAQQSSSGCGVCASTGDCNQAFKGQEGQYCGTFYSQIGKTSKPCCCPSFPVTCKLTSNSCMCHVPADSTDASGGGGGSSPSSTATTTQHSTNNNNNNHNSHHGQASPTSAPLISSNAISGVLSTLFWLLILGGCVSCCFGCCCNKSNPNGSSEKVSLAPAATNPNYQPNNTYGATAPYESNQTTGNNVSNQSNIKDGGTNSASGGWLSGLGGMAVGAALGSGVQRQWDRTNAGGGGYEDVTGYRDSPDDSGGYDIAGDTGDGVGGTYDIGGDTGDGGGYDISGDF